MITTRTKDTKRLAMAAYALAAAVGVAGCQTTAATPVAANTVRVGGAPMYPTKDIVDNAVNSKDHTTLVAAVQAAGLVETLKAPGPYTVFAPTNEAFDKLPPGTVDTLLLPEHKPDLQSVLAYHVVPGALSKADLTEMVRQGGGRATLTTAQGHSLTIRQNGPRNLIVIDAKGGVANIETYDVIQSNGVIHVVDKVLLP
jgi:uncharacterized surface protein with fasciclin (FAS1) repeats